MLKVTTLVIAAAAALGMSSAGAQTSPGGSSSGWSYYTHPDGSTRVYAGGSPVGGFQATQSGNTTKFTYNPPPSSPAPVAPSSPSAGNYTTIKRMGDGFTLEQRANLPVPGRDLTHPVALRKPVPPAAMAKALAKTLPIVGNAFAMAELLQALFPDSTPSYNASAGQWNLTTPGYIWRNNSGNVTASSASGVCEQVTPNGWFYTLDSFTGTAGRCVLWYGSPDNHGGYEYVQRVAAPATTSPVTQQDIENAYPPAATDPAVQDAAEELLPYIPDPAKKDLAQDSAGPGVSVIPYTPNGQPSFEPWTSPESISTTSTQASSEIITTTKRTTTTATPVQDGVRYDTTTTTTTERQQLDPVTGLPDGPPTTETTTETTEQTPSKPAEGEDLECGLPGTPPCKIDETGTPGTDEANFDKGEEEIENFKSGLFAKVQEKLDEITHEWTWTFALPTGCAALQFDTQVGPVVQIDMCEWQPMIHDIMSMVWAAAGVFGAMMIFLRSNG